MSDQLEQMARMALEGEKSLNLGPFLLAGLFDSILCGFILMQGGRYFGSSTKDPWFCKGAVAYVLLMNLAGTSLTWAWVYDLFVLHFGSYVMFISSKYISWFFVINSITIVVVQAFFGWRAWRLMNRSKIVAVIIITLVLAAAIAGVGLKVVCYRLGGVLNPAGLRLPAYICMSCTVAADTMITSIILYYIFSNRKQGSRQTTRILTRIARITFESQLPPTVSIITLLFVYIFTQEKRFFFVPILVVKLKSYGISFLHTLNSRDGLKKPSLATTLSYKADTTPTVWATGTRAVHIPSGSFTARDAEVSISVVSVVTSEEAKTTAIDSDSMLGAPETKEVC